MQKAIEFLCSMQQKGATIWTERGQLRYRAPHASLTRDDICVLHDLKDEIVSFLGDSQSLVEVLRGPTPVASFGPIPVSIQQEGMWNIRHTLQLVLAVKLRISGNFDYGVFRSCLTNLLRRHESLRTRIVLTNGVPTQHIDDPYDYVLDVDDISRVSKNISENEAQRAIERFLAEKPDLNAGSLFRAKLFKFSEHEHALAIAVHHAITDGLSITLMLRELWASYKDLVTVGQIQLPDAPIQYADYAIWQRKTLPYWRLKNGSYWSALLSRAKQMELPIRSSSNDIEPYTTAPLQISLGKALSDQLYDLANNQRTIPALLMFAVGFAALSQWCKQKDLWIASVFSGRYLRNCESVLGFLAQGFLLQVDMSGHETFIELLRRVVDEFQTACEHLECGVVFEGLDERDLGPTALIQWISFDPFAVNPIYLRFRKSGSGADLLVESFPATSPTGFKTVGALEIIFMNSIEGIRAHGYYRADLFAASTIQRFSRDLHRMCEQIVRNPKLRLASFVCED